MSRPRWLPSANYEAQMREAQAWGAQQVARLLAEGYEWECDEAILVKRNAAGEVESTVEF